MKHNAFTLIEMLIVIVIIGILAAALIPRLQSIQSRVRNSARVTYVGQIASALSIHHMDMNAHPVRLSHLVSSGYMTSIPDAPQKNIDPCAAILGYVQTSFYQSSGFYADGGSCSDPFTCTAYNGFLYGKSNSLHNMSFISATMENDGSNNSHNAANVCARPYAGNFENHATALPSIDTAVTNGLTEKGKAYVRIIK